MIKGPILRLSSEERREEKLWNLLDDSDPALRLYVYRSRRGKKLIPALINGYPFPGLFEHLRDRYGSGDYCIMIRRGRTMEVSLVVAIEAPINWRGPAG